MKIKKVFFVIITLFLIVYFIITHNKTNIELKSAFLTESKISNTEDVYDVILFFGQSNMAGYSSIGIEPRYQLTNDSAGRQSVSDYSAKTGIDEDILRNSWVTNYTITDVTPNTVYEYHAIDNSLYDLSDLESNGYTANNADITVNKFNGELLYYDYTTYKFYHRWSIDRPNYIKENSYSLYNANGTNMINEFAKQYYTKTGHKVVCVCVAMGGSPLERFDPQKIYQDEHGTSINLYAAMSNKYLAALRYLENHNLKIGNKSFIMFQGENETENNNTSFVTSYKNYFKRIKSQLNQDLGINKGAIVLTGFTPGLSNGISYAAGVKAMNQTQRELINENSDVILGSDFPYKHYVPGEADYNNTALYDYKTNMGGVDYNTALKNAQLVVGDGYGNNLIHFTSAALAQIGRETAINMYNSMVKNISTVTVKLEKNSYTYDGTAKTPKVTVIDGSTTLTEEVDYSVKYSNNTNAGTAKVIITGKGSYSGSKEVSFQIAKAQIEAQITEYSGLYDGRNHGISITVTKPQTGATIKYGTSQGNCTLSTSPTYKDPGTYTIYYKITASNYETKEGHATIQIGQKNISEVNVTLNPTEFTYDGTEKTPKVTVTDGDTTLKEKVDYSVDYADNKNAGTAKVIITGKGLYSGNKEVTFQIAKAQIEAKITGYSGLYDGRNHGISITVAKPQEGATIKYGTSQEDCTLPASPEYKDPGTYTVYYKITAPNYETKEGHATVQIGQKNIDEVNVTLNPTEFTYDGTEKTPKVTVTDGDTTLKEKVDYSVDYADNTNAGTAKVIITGKGLYSGSKEVSFQIAKAQIEAKIAGYNGLYDGENHGITITVTKPQEGATIKYGTSQEDCTLPASPEYKDTGTYTVYYKIIAQNYKTKKGSTQITIDKKDISNAKVTLDKTQYIYDGQPKTPKVEVKSENVILVKDIDYTVKYENNVNDGTGKVIITGNGNYTGTITQKFEIKAEKQSDIVNDNKPNDNQNDNSNNKPNDNSNNNQNDSQNNKPNDNSNSNQDNSQNNKPSNNSNNNQNDSQNNKPSNISNNNQNNSQNYNKDNTTSKDTIPNTGMKGKLIIFGMTISGSIAIICFKKHKKWAI